MNNEFTLDRPIRVHVGYFTVWVGDNGEPNYYNDYYGHQQRITLARAGKWDQIDVGEDHLAAVDTSKLKEIGSARDRRGLRAIAASTRRWGWAAFRLLRYAPSGNSVGDIVRRSLGFGY